MNIFNLVMIVFFGIGAIVSFIEYLKTKNKIHWLSVLGNLLVFCFLGVGALWDNGRPNAWGLASIFIGLSCLAASFLILNKPRLSIVFLGIVLFLLIFGGGILYIENFWK